ncbi:hypothetical protein D9758_000879 [Tetrapyrgos nigripes]|uniref:Ig-like domain-containing protein n=1 Tax=Tetrapyrgos nigripes TaxID=182062 RepID=A0A8H5LY00_9AGAR|nr:hypothetical protein D9758_000879 [Tetrapyrgos nigripes]
MSNILMPSRHNASNLPSTSAYSTPSSASRTARALSPPISQSTSYSSTIMPFGNNAKLNIVTRVAIEGKAKQGKDGANIKMYLKMSIPVDSVTPGSTVQLFPEENIKITTAHVHPLDSNSVPYNFSSTDSPLLHSAARALNLPARSHQTFHSAFGLSPPPTSASVTESVYTSKTNGSAKQEFVPPVDERYTGHIVVSGYHIAFVLPKVFPPRHTHDGAGSYSRRRSSIGERNSAQFMAAIDMWVTYLCRPPRSPYLLSIPTPRCLHNNIKLRIFPPSNISSSYASVSSTEEDGGSWDLASDPPVATTISRLSRSNTHQQFADDESSDSSTAGFSFGCGIQGTFPSAERIRVRWARPTKILTFPEGLTDGRRRAGVKDVKGEMTCAIKGKARDPERDVDGVIMDVEYKGTCSGVWFAGVATLLGLDVGLVAKNSDVSWVPGAPREWEVSGGVGYTGFDSGAKSNTASHNTTRHDSFDSNTSPHLYVSPASPDANGIFNPGRPRSESESKSVLGSRQNSTSSAASSTSSLLRAPLPNQSVADYSFEGSASSSQVTSSLSSLTGDESSNPSNAHSRSNSQSLQHRELPPPGQPIALHLNMNELLPPQNKPFTFTISGTILVTPRPSLPRINGSSPSNSRSATLPASEESETDRADSGGLLPDSDQNLPITPPRFTVLAADSETTSIIIRNDIDDVGGYGGGPDSTVEVYKSSSDPTRKTVVQKGSYTKVSNGENGVRVVVKLQPSSLLQNGLGHGPGYAAGRGTYGNGYVYGQGGAAGSSRSLQPPSRSRTPSRSESNSPVIGTGITLPRAPSYTSLAKLAATTIPFARPRRDGPLMIPWVSISVTPLPSDPNSEAKAQSQSSASSTPKSFLVRATFPAPADTGSEWVEFGLGTDSSDQVAPRVNVVDVSVEGVPVKFETTAAAAKEEEGSLNNPSGSDATEFALGGIKFEEMTGKNWVTWIRVHVGAAGGGTVVVDYVQTASNKQVNNENGSPEKRKGKARARETSEMPVYIPTFTVPVGRFEVLVESTSELAASSVLTTIRHIVLTKFGHKLLHFSTDAYFPHRVIPIFSNSPSLKGSKTNSPSSWATYLSLLSFLTVIFGCTLVLSMHSDLSRMRDLSEQLPLLVGSGWNDLPAVPPETVTVTSTLYTSNTHRWWFGDGRESESAPLSSSTDPPDSDHSTSLGVDNTLPSSSSVTPVHPGSVSRSNTPASTVSSRRSTSPISRPTSKSIHDETSALDTIHKLFDLRWEDMRPVAQSVYQVVTDTANMVWYTVRWIYHYPLPPP